MYQILAIVSPSARFSARSFLSIGVCTLNAMLCCGVAVAQPKQNNRNHVGPTVTFVNGSSAFGVAGKFQLTENVFEVKNALSLRPYIRFGNSVDFGAGVTYDFDFPRYSQVTPYAGIGLGSFNGTTSSSVLGAPSVIQNVSEVAFYGQAGVEINASQNLSLSGNIQVPFNGKLSTNFTLGANYRF
jgi:opacity protein-like surface antigen